MINRKRRNRRNKKKKKQICNEERLKRVIEDEKRVKTNRRNSGLRGDKREEEREGTNK